MTRTNYRLSKTMLATVAGALAIAAAGTAVAKPNVWPGGHHPGGHPNTPTDVDHMNGPDHIHRRHGVAVIGAGDWGYGYGGDCGYLHYKARETDRAYWWRRYHACREY